MAARRGAPQGPQNSSSLLQAQQPVGLRGSKVGPGAQRAHPFQQEMRCGCKPTVPGEGGFPVKCRALGSPTAPLILPFLQAFHEHAFFPEVDFPKCTFYEGIDRKVEPGPHPVRESQQGQAHRSSEDPPSRMRTLPQGPRNPGWVGGPLGVCINSKCPRLAPHQKSSSPGCREHPAWGRLGGLDLPLPPLIPHQTVFKLETRACQTD